MLNGYFLNISSTYFYTKTDKSVSAIDFGAIEYFSGF